MTSFNDFGLAEPITRALADENYTTPTPIQAQTIPLALEGRDVIGIAQTGTGKTAAFAIPALNRILAKRFRPERKTCRILVLSPTRELSGQIEDSFRTYGRHVRPLAVALAIGGVPINRQIRAMANGVEVLVATPGRLLDLVHQRAVYLHGIETLVLDEADRMLDMGFVRDIRKIVALLPKERQTLFFSATMPQEIVSLAKDMLRDPARVSVTPQATTAERINQRIVHVDKSDKAALLTRTIKSENVDRVIVFSRTKHGADKIVRNLEKDGIASHALHGNRSQSQRERALAAFRDGSVRTLVATDIAARGIDVDGVSHVINYDLPNVPESYVHRIGRTARAGAEGIAISFCDREETAYLRDIERLIRMKIPATDERAARSGHSHRHDRPQGERQGERNGERRGERQGQHQGQLQGQRQNPRQDRNQDRSQDRREDRQAHNGNTGPKRHDRTPREQVREGQPRHQGRNEQNRSGGHHAAGRPGGHGQHRRPQNGDQRGNKPLTRANHPADKSAGAGALGHVGFMQQPSRPAAQDEQR